jgi:para-nitrobenzyl esterase
LNEWKFLHLFIPNFTEVDTNGLHENANKILSHFKKGERLSEQIIKAYQIAREGKLSTLPQDILDAIETDVNFRLYAIRLAEAQSKHQPKTYVYLFTLKSPMLDGKLGAPHAMDIPFIFGTLDKPNAALYSGEGDAVNALSEKMMDAWIAFIRSGDPNHSNIPEWPTYDIDKRSTMIFGEEVKIEEKPFDEERAAWDGLFY